jgi:HAD superfamily hydrolase (TIGR01509 family)
MQPELVIFDCDGVLVDSELLACRISAECLTEAEFVISADDVMERYVGVSLKAMLADIEDRYRRTLPPEFADVLRQRMAAAFAAELRPIDGVQTVLAGLTCRRCVASGNAVLRHTLTVAGLLHYFDPHVFSATQVARGKPAPDLFLFAAASMQVAPERCVVIEDSQPGVLAAVAAGMRAIGFTGGGHCRPGHAERLRAAGAVAVTSDMARLPALLTGE